MVSQLFASIRSNPYYEKDPTQSLSALPRLSASVSSRPQSILQDPTKATSSPEDRTRIFIERSTWGLLGVRSLILAGAAATLVCSFSLRNLQLEQSYTLKVPPCIDILTTTYAIYRILSPRTHQRSATAASHHFLALIVDAGITPFYVFIVLLAKGASDVNTQDESLDIWSSTFSSAVATKNVISAIWTLSIIVGVLHVMASVLSCGLFFAFCRVAKIENIESRLTTRSHRSLPYESLAGEKSPAPSVIQTRSNSDTRYSAHNPQRTISTSRLNLDLPALPLGTRALRPTPSKNSAFFTSHEGSSSQSFGGSSFYSDEEGAPPLPRRSSKRKSDIMSAVVPDNYIAQTDDQLQPAGEAMPPATLRGSSSISAFDFAIGKYRGAAYRALAQDSSPASNQSSPHHTTYDVSTGMQPLQMNPPTPPLPPRTQFLSPPTNGSPTAAVKSRYYGDLGHPSDLELFSNQHTTSPEKQQNIRMVNSTGLDVSDIGLQTGTRMHESETETGYEGASGVMKAGLRGRVVSGKAAEEGRVGDEVVPAQEQADGSLGRNSWGSMRWLKARGGW